MSTALTVDQFKDSLPPKMKKNVTQDLVDRVNALISNPDMYEYVRDNLISYVSVLNDGKYKIEQYVDAVTYVSHKLLGKTNGMAYADTFPDRMARYHANKTSEKDIASYVTAYNKNKLVNDVWAQAIIPAHIYNQDLYQRALNVQADLMMNAKSEKVRTDAANSLLTQLKMPEVKKIEMNIGLKEDSTINALRESTMALVAAQKAAIQSGSMNAQEVAHSKLIIDQDMQEV